MLEKDVFALFIFDSGKIEYNRIEKEKTWEVLL